MISFYGGLGGNLRRVVNLVDDCVGFYIFD